MKIVKNKWEFNETEQDFDEAVREEIELISVRRWQSVLADVLLKLVDKEVLTPVEVINLLGADWVVPE